MNADVHHRTQPTPDADCVSRDLVEIYTSALVAGDAETALGCLSSDAVFESPFNTWPARHVAAVFRARCVAFANLRIGSVIRGERAVALPWMAEVDGSLVDGLELLATDGETISRIDVYLRPAGVLDTVHRAMARAWPR